MLPIARLLKAQGAIICGSDRAFDQGQTPEKFQVLQEEGMRLYRQDGSGIAPHLDAVIASSAIERTVPDLKRANELGLPIYNKAEILARFINQGKAIAVSGTSGKTTVTGMIGFVLEMHGLAPQMMNGGHIVNFWQERGNGNALTGKGDIFVCETDESDNSVSSYNPAVTILNNITMDHKPIEELRVIFSDLLKRTRETVILNMDDPEVAALYMTDVAAKIITFGIKTKCADFIATDIQMHAHGSDFNIIQTQTGESAAIHIRMPGQHNILNALAACCAAYQCDISLSQFAEYMCEFKGIKRRFEVVSHDKNATIIDDFGHNPDKIQASLRTLAQYKGRKIVVFQPHGFGPTKMMKDDLIEVVASLLQKDDIFIMPEIYYAGGQAQKDISSSDIITALKEQGVNAHFFNARGDIPKFVQGNHKAGDIIMVMGARDDTLSDFAKTILSA